MEDTRREERRSDTCEVFTPSDTVRKMLDKLPSEMFEAEKTFLDNSCGNGNMLVEVLLRKLENAPSCKKHTSANLKEGNVLGYTVDTQYACLCANSLYGTDMMEDNVVECRERISNIVWNHAHFLGWGTFLYLEDLSEALKEHIVCTKMEDWDYEKWCPVFEKLF